MGRRSTKDSSEEKVAAEKTVRDAVSDRLKKLRKGGIGTNNRPACSQDDLAQKIGFDGKTVGKWEQKESSPTPEALYLISKYYGVSVDWILGLQDHWTLEENEKIAVKTTGLSDKAISSLIKVTHNDEVFANIGGKDYSVGEIDAFSLDVLLCLNNLPRYLSAGKLLKFQIDDVRKELKKGNNDYLTLRDKLEMNLFSFTERMKELADDLYSYNRVINLLRELEVLSAYRKAGMSLETEKSLQEKLSGSDF